MSMDVSAAAWAPRRRELSMLNTVLAVTLLALPLPGLGSACTPNINLPKNSKAGQTQNHSLSLRCPVHLCFHDKPIVTWCKVERRGNSQCENVKSDDRISFGWEEKTENEAVHVLKFQFVQINDTGFYQCLVVFKGIQIVGSVIEVTVPVSSPATAATEHATVNMPNSNGPSPKPFIGDTSKTWTTYFSIAVRMIIIIVISALLYCYLREVKANHTLFKRTFSKTKFVSASRTTCKICSENTLDIDPPTESFEMICDGLGEDELTVVFSPKEETLISGTLENSKEGTEY